MLLTDAIERAQPPIPGTQPPAPDPRRWRLGGGPYQIDVGELPVRVWLADAALRPDANLLLPDEWERLLRLVFNYEKPQAEAAARRITQARTQLSAQRGLKGFGSMHELMVTAGLDRDTVYGTGGDSPALAQLLSLGTGQKRLEANLAPLPLVQAMADAPAAAAVRARRARDRLTEDFSWREVAERTEGVYLAAKRRVRHAYGRPTIIERPLPERDPGQ